MQKLTIKGKTDSEIIIDEDFNNLSKYLPSKNVIIITDDNLYNFYSKSFPDFPVIKIGVGEQIKTLQTVEFITNKLIELQADRHSFLLGIGGGIVCDITGFVASIYMRGIKFGFVSTSLLSQVDASLGGKNGVNFNSYKNIIGNFNQPKFVICDTKMLKTLPQKEIKNGMGEIVKHCLIADKKMYDRVRNDIPQILDLEQDIISDLIYNSVKIKSAIVNKDETEQGKRKKLNFGHTLGHAIEKHSNISHGEAISIGMVFSAHLSYKKGLIAKNDVGKIIDLLNKLDLPTSTNIDKQKLADAILNDKKRNSNTIDFVLITEIGNAIIETFSIEELKNEILNYEL
jgi:3-dehydroquinate synthase